MPQNRINSNTSGGKRSKLKTGKKLPSSSSKLSSGKRRKFKGTRLFKILRLALLILIILIIVNIISDVVHKNPKNITLVIGDNKVSLKHKILTDKDSNFYVSLDDISSIYDSNIYYSNDTVITTYNKHIAVLEMDKTTMSINDTVTEIKGKMKKEDGIVYLPFSDMKLVFDFEYSYNKDRKVLIVDSISEEKNEAVVLKNCKLKESTKNFAKTLEKVKKTKTVKVLGQEGKYTKVRTETGNIGFLKTKKLSKTEIKRSDMEEEKLTNIEVLNDYSIVNSGYSEVPKDASKTKIVIPNLFNISENGEEIVAKNVIDLSGKKFEGYKQWAEQNEVNVCGTVTLNTSMNKVCSNYVTRTFIINSLYTEVVKNQIPMICIDFENIDDTEGFYRFIIEMVPRFKEAGIKVLVKAKSGMNKDRLVKIVDYVID